MPFFLGLCLIFWGTAHLSDCAAAEAEKLPSTLSLQEIKQQEEEVACARQEAEKARQYKSRRWTREGSEALMDDPHRSDYLNSPTLQDARRRAIQQRRPFGSSADALIHCDPRSPRHLRGSERKNKKICEGLEDLAARRLQEEESQILLEEECVEDRERAQARYQAREEKATRNARLQKPQRARRPGLEKGFGWVKKLLKRRPGFDEDADNAAWNDVAGMGTVTGPWGTPVRSPILPTPSALDIQNLNLALNGDSAAAVALGVVPGALDKSTLIQQGLEALTKQLQLVPPPADAQALLAMMSGPRGLEILAALGLSQIPTRVEELEDILAAFGLSAAKQAAQAAAAQALAQGPPTAQDIEFAKALLAGKDPTIWQNLLDKLSPLAPFLTIDTLKAALSGDKETLMQRGLAVLSQQFNLAPPPKTLEVLLEHLNSPLGKALMEALGLTEIPSNAADLLPFVVAVGTKAQIKTLLGDAAQQQALIQKGLELLTTKLGLSPAPATLQALFDLLKTPAGAEILKALGLTEPPSSVSELLPFVVAFATKEQLPAVPDDAAQQENLVQEGLAILSEKEGLSPAPSSLQALFDLLKTPVGAQILKTLGLTDPPGRVEELLPFVVALATKGNLRALLDPAQQQLILQAGIKTLSEQVGLSPAPANLQAIFDQLQSPLGTQILAALGLPAAPGSAEELLPFVMALGKDARLLGLLNDPAKRKEIAQKAVALLSEKLGLLPAPADAQALFDLMQTPEGAKILAALGLTEVPASLDELLDKLVAYGLENGVDQPSAENPDAPTDQDAAAPTGQAQAAAHIADAKTAQNPRLGEALTSAAMGPNTAGLNEISDMAKTMSPVDSAKMTALVEAKKKTLAALGLAAVSAALGIDPPLENMDQLFEMAKGAKGGAILSLLNLDTLPQAMSDFENALAVGGLGAFMEKQAYEAALAAGASVAEALKQSQAYGDIIAQIGSSLVTPQTRAAVQAFSANKKTELLLEAMAAVSKTLNLDPPVTSMDELMQKFQGDSAILLAQKLGMSAPPQTLADLQRELIALAQRATTTPLDTTPKTPEELKKMLLERDQGLLAVAYAMCQGASDAEDKTGAACGEMIRTITSRMASHAAEGEAPLPGQAPAYAQESEDEAYLYSKNPSAYADAQELEEAEEQKAKGGFQYKSQQAVRSGEAVAKSLDQTDGQAEDDKK